MDYDKPITNRFDIVVAASIRVRELKRGHKPKVETKNKECMTAIKEIEEGKIKQSYLLKVK